MRPLIARWPMAAVLLGVAVLYQLVSERRAVIPPRLLLVLIVVLLLAIGYASWRGWPALGRRLAVAVMSIVTAVVTISTAFLVRHSTTSPVEISGLLHDGALLWVTNILVFALWYWEVDGGGPLERSPSNYRSKDFLFPQSTVEGSDAEAWAPRFVDYLFLAFNTSTAFSPTDTLTLSHRAKLLVMMQSGISLLCVVVIVARAINAL